MLSRKENEIEIWTDTVKKGKGKKCIIIGLITMLIFIILAIPMKMDFTIIETYIFIIAIYFIPSYLFFISGIIYIKREKKPERIIARVNKDFIEIYTKKEKRKIMLNQITKLNKISSTLGTFIVILYNDKEKENKYSFEISSANKNLLVMAIQEYRKDIAINDIK